MVAQVGARQHHHHHGCVKIDPKYKMVAIAVSACYIGSVLYKKDANIFLGVFSASLLYHLKYEPKAMDLSSFSGCQQKVLEFVGQMEFPWPIALFYGVRSLSCHMREAEIVQASYIVGRASASCLWYVGRKLNVIR